MAPESFVLDPELEQLLVEVAADPDSCLLRVPRPKALPALFESDTRVSDRMAGLSLAERELLRVHRRELAELLLEVCRYKLIEGPRSRHVVLGYDIDGRRREPSAPNQVVNRVEVACGAFDSSFSEGVLALVHACVAVPESEGPNAGDIAVAALRVSPSLQARGLAAQFHAQSGAPRTALIALQDALSECPTRTAKATVWSTVGVAYSMLGHHGSSLAAYVQACSLAPTYVQAWGARLLLACQAGRTDDAVAAGQAVDQLSIQQPSVLSAMIAAESARRRLGEWLPNSTGRECARVAERRLAGASKELVHVML